MNGFSLNADGFFVIAEPGFSFLPENEVGIFADGLNIENDDALTFKLVRGVDAGLMVPFDLDTDSDGVLDMPLPWNEELDCVATTVPSGADDIFCDTVVSPPEELNLNAYGTHFFHFEMHWLL